MSVACHSDPLMPLLLQAPVETGTVGGEWLSETKLAFLASVFILLHFPPGTVFGELLGRERECSPAAHDSQGLLHTSRQRPVASACLQDTLLTGPIGSVREQQP